MFLPIGDTPNPRRFTPWVTWGLIAVNVAVYVFVTFQLMARPVNPKDPNLLEYLRNLITSLPPGISPRAVLAQTSAYDVFVFAHGYKPGAPELLDLFTSMFLHGGLLHLAGNMLFLWIYGDNVEHRLGRIGYLVVYLATGVVATLSYGIFAGDSMIPLVGASGAISGVLGLYFLLFPRNNVKVFVFLFPLFFNVFLLPARWVLGFFVVVDNLLPILVSADSSVAYGAHLGGFVGGLAVAAAGERLAWRWPWTDRYWRLGRRRRKPASSTSPLTELQDAIRRGDRKAALSLLPGLAGIDTSTFPPGHCVVLSGWLAEAGHPIAAANLLKRCLATHRSSSDLAEVYLALGLMRLRGGQPTAAYQHLLSVFDYDPAPEVAERARQAIAGIDVYRRR